MVTYSPAAVRGLISTLVRHVFDEPVPDGTPCAQDWREARLVNVINEAFADEPGPVDGSMPWHAYMPPMCPSPMRDGMTAAECIKRGECGCDNRDKRRFAHWRRLAPYR